MTSTRPWSRREVWTRKLIYPGHTFPTAIAPVLVAVGLAVHDGVFRAVPAFLALMAGWLIQFAGVVTDNYENLVRQPDDTEHPELADAVKRGLLTMSQIKLTIIVCYSLAAIVGLVLVTIAGRVVIVIGAASIIASWIYSAGPWPAGRHGLADPLFFLFFGIVSVAGTYYVQAERLSFAVLAVSIPAGALITSILIIDDIRDREFDAIKGKRTIAVRFGAHWSRYEFSFLLAIAYMAPIWFWLGLGFGAMVLLPLLTIPLALVTARAVWTRQSFRELIPMTPRMAMLTVAYCLCLGIGLSTT